MITNDTRKVTITKHDANKSIFFSMILPLDLSSNETIFTFKIQILSVYYGIYVNDMSSVDLFQRCVHMTM